MPLKNKTHWIFDMDGTLTHAIHDFEAIRKDLGLPAGLPILESLANLPTEEAAEVRKNLDAMEYEIAKEATLQPGAEELLNTLNSINASVGILTRNGKGIAFATLEACGVRNYFHDDHIVSRDCCTPKPDGAGVTLLLKRWNTSPDSAVMIGDFLFDLEAGRKGGIATVHLDVAGEFAWPELSDVCVQSLGELQERLTMP